MFTLRPPHGAFAVGATTLTSPVQPPSTVGSGLTVDGQALVLDEIAFTLFYPTESKRKGPQSIPWLLRPVYSTFVGFSRFSGISAFLLWPIVYLFGVLLKIPVHPNAPLLHPPENIKQWPLVFFSHGLGGSRTAYSQVCAELASSGRVVLAIEHRDGTSPATTARNGRTVLYYREQDVAFPEDMKLGVLPLRTDQLAFRRQEIYRIFEAFSALVNTKDAASFAGLEGEQVDLGGWQSSTGVPLVKCDNLTLAGHSFGGCTVLDVLSSPPCSPSSPLPVAKALLLDPWLEPLPTPGPTLVHPPSSLRLLVINSQTFTLWNDHFTRLLDLVKEWDSDHGKLLTLVGSVHHSFSDFAVFPLVRKRPAELIMDRITTLSLSFLNDNLQNTLTNLPTRDMETVVIGKRPDGRPRRSLVGATGDVVVM
ncbi:N-acetyltransferase domain-containing protein [Mycena indigotica]|uniref:Putative phospholipase n=1 Tax=Mycena indigotica TaxID=2126181 RepID=A0A8H6SPX5_9AGAR|nr:N-acetyltransferase domain-containing protein [Mycena indigotica]KAF7301825.1 N-acetyltransferase domain-containing protein [Mycena indigotica]